MGYKMYSAAYYGFEEAYIYGEMLPKFFHNNGFFFFK